MRGFSAVVFISFARLALLAAWTITGWPAPVSRRREPTTNRFFPAWWRVSAMARGIPRRGSIINSHFTGARSLPMLALPAASTRRRGKDRLLVSKRGDYRFYVFGSGEVEVKIAERVAIPRQTIQEGWLKSAVVPLAADFQPVELSFRRTNKDARLMVLWSGPDFGLEPIPPHALFHPRAKPVARDFERGQLLTHVLRCGRCHADGPAPPPAPALDRLKGDLARDWLVRWLLIGNHVQAARRDREDEGEPLSPRRMPDFGFSQTQAEAIADWLLSAGERDRSLPAAPREEKPKKKAPKPSAQIGERLFLTLGCLACHTWRDLGASGWLGGGDLTHIADKRPADYFAAWLTDPARLNADHRMPVFSLSGDERTSLAPFLAAQQSEGSKPDFSCPRFHGATHRRAKTRRAIPVRRLPSTARSPG